MGKRERISLIDYTKQFLYPNCNLPTKWIYIDGEKSDYKIRSDGAVISMKQPVKDGVPYILCGGMDNDGYHLVTLHHNLKYYTRKVHRLVAEAFIPNPNNLPEVNHINGDKMDNDVNNLEWIDTYDNVHHAMEHNLRQQTLTELDVERVCSLLATNEYSIKEISIMTGISCGNISKIKNRDRWWKATDKFDLSINDYKLASGE